MVPPGQPAGYWTSPLVVGGLGWKQITRTPGIGRGHGVLSREAGVPCEMARYDARCARISRSAVGSR